jgi:hypothetical protein
MPADDDEATFVSVLLTRQAVKNRVRRSYIPADDDEATCVCHVYQTVKNRLGASGEASVRAVVDSILREKGLRGLYAGYRATLMRNIPSAVLRFTLYEEFKLALQVRSYHKHTREAAQRSGPAPGG